MNESFTSSMKLPGFSLWEKMRSERKVFSFDIEITARCNHNCRHCYINLPVTDKEAQKKELSFAEIKKIIDKAASLGALWCIITGGEPLLREDFSDIYMYFKKKGLLVSVFTNATLITEEHIKLFKEYPPRDIEVTVYGVTKDTYEKICRKPGSFDAFMNGLNLLLHNGIRVRFKAMALRSNMHELPQIARFCRERTRDYFRFDPFLHLRLDGNPLRNQEIESERLSPTEITAIEKADPERFQAMKNTCDRLINPEFSNITCNHLFHCGAGNRSFAVSYDGFFRLCCSLQHPDCIYDLRKGSLTEAWQDFAPKVRDMRSNNEKFLETCRKCELVNLCMWCPARCHLETGELDKQVEYFCEIAHARAAALVGK